MWRKIFTRFLKLVLVDPFHFPYSAIKRNDEKYSQISMLNVDDKRNRKDWNHLKCLNSQKKWVCYFIFLKYKKQTNSSTAIAVM